MNIHSFLSIFYAINIEKRYSGKLIESVTILFLIWLHSQKKDLYIYINLYFFFGEIFFYRR